MSIISNDISQAVKHLKNEDVVAIPTETVYGLAGSIFSEAAIQKIFSVKQRPKFNPLIVHLYSMDQLNNIVEELPEKAKILAQHFWPGPLTLVLKKKATVPDLVTAGKDTVAIRIPRHPITLELLKSLDFPIAAPSANPFNRISPTTAQHVESYFKDEIPMVLDGGPCTKGLESTIVGFENGEAILYRLGSTSIEAIEEQIGSITIRNKKENAPDAPGMLAKHYSPRTKTYLVDDVARFISNFSDKSIGLITLNQKFEAENIKHRIELSTAANLEEAASKLYQSLHYLDSLGLDMIVAERLPDRGLGKTINDRLKRASS